MSKILDELRKERDQVRAAAIAIAESDDFDPEDKNFQDLETRAAELDTRISKLGTVYQAQADADALDGKLAKREKQRQDDEQQRQSAQQTETRGSWGARFVESGVYQDHQQRGFRGTSAHLSVDAVQTRALPTGIGELIEAGFKGAETRIDTSAPPLPTPLLDAISTVTVSGNSIEYVAWSKVAGGADVVPEKGAKPSVEFAPTVVPSVLENIAGYTQLTRQMVEDFATVRSKIDGDLQREVLLKEEAQAAAALTAAAFDASEGDDLLSAIRLGIAAVQANGYTPNAVLLNPADWAALDIDVMGTTVDGPTRRFSFWGLTPVPAAGQAEGQAVVGDLRTAVEHYTRSAVSLYITDSHANTFLENVFTLLAERRSKTVVVRPQAAVRVSAAAPVAG